MHTDTPTETTNELAAQLGLVAHPHARSAASVALPAVQNVETEKVAAELAAIYLAPATSKRRKQLLVAPQLSLFERDDDI